MLKINHSIRYARKSALNAGRSVGVMAWLIALSGCSSVSIPYIWELDNQLDEVTVESLSGANRNNPVAFDLVFIYDKDLSMMLAGLTGPEWFAQKTDLMFRFRDGIDVVGAEIVPRSKVRGVSLPDDSTDAVQILLFANYVTPDGQIAADVTGFYELRIRLEGERYVLQELDS